MTATPASAPEPDVEDRDHEVGDDDDARPTRPALPSFPRPHLPSLVRRPPTDPLRIWRQRDRVRAVAAGISVTLAVLGLISATSPPLWRRLHVVLDLVPGVVPTSAASTLAAVSVVMLLASRGLRRGQRLAWDTTMALLALSLVLHLAKGLDVEEAVLVGIGLVWLGSQRGAFAVQPTRAALRRVLVLAVPGVVLVVAFSVGLDALLPEQRFGRMGHLLSPVMIVAGVALVLAALWVALSPSRPRTLTPAQHHDERERARKVVAAHGGGTLDYFALRDDKDWFFVEESVVAHSVRAGVCLVSPDPIGPADEREAVWAEFLQHVQRNGWSVAVLAAHADWLAIYEASGLRVVYLGDEATVHCPSFSLAGHDHKSLRQAVGRITRAGYVTTFHDPAELDSELREEILSMSEESRQGDAERGFSMTLSRLCDPEDTGLMMSVLRNADGRPDAFIQWVPAPDIDGWSLDVMRRRTDDPELPNGLVDACIVATVAELVRRGQTGLGLNFAVMRTILDGEATGPLADLARPILQQLSDHTQMASLAKFNDKFDPHWTPRYVVLDSVEYIATQGLVMAGAEGVSEIPVVGRFLGRLS